VRERPQGPVTARAVDVYDSADGRRVEGVGERRRPVEADLLGADRRHAYLAVQVEFGEDARRRDHGGDAAAVVECALRDVVGVVVGDDDDLLVGVGSEDGVGVPTGPLFCGRVDRERHSAVPLGVLLEPRARLLRGADGGISPSSPNRSDPVGGNWPSLWL